MNILEEFRTLTEEELKTVIGGTNSTPEHDRDHHGHHRRRRHHHRWNHWHNRWDDYDDWDDDWDD